MSVWKDIKAEAGEWLSAAGCVALPVLWVCSWSLAGAGVAWALDRSVPIGGMKTGRWRL